MKLVLIDWRDAYGCSPDWQLIPDPLLPKLMVCRSVGWLAYDGQDCKVIIPHISSDDHPSVKKQGCGDMTIPTGAIISIVELTPLVSE